MASAGRILIMPKGDYNASTTYEMLDLVNHNSISWLAKKTVVGIEPSEANKEYWHSMCDFDIVNKKIENLNESIILLSTTEDYSAWTEVATSVDYSSYKYIYIELRDTNDSLMDSVFIPKNAFTFYNKGETPICLANGDMWANVITQSSSSVHTVKSGGKLVIWGMEKIF